MPYKDRNKKLEYHKRYNKANYQKYKAVILAAKYKHQKDMLKLCYDIKSKSKCERCPENDPICLDFHHVDKSKKFASIPVMIHHGNSKEKILAEIAKCIILCANCHRKEHRKDHPNHKLQSSVV